MGRRRTWSFRADETYRLGGESGGYCGWNKETRDKMSAKEWSKIVYDFANETIEWEKSGVIYRALEKIKE